MKILIIGYGKMGKAIEAIAPSRGMEVAGIATTTDELKETLNSSSNFDVALEFTSPESGLDVALGQLPLDLHLLCQAISTHLRVRNLVPKNWAGKGPGQNGKPGHIKRIESILHTLNVPTFGPCTSAKGRWMCIHCRRKHLLSNLPYIFPSHR